MTYINNHIEAIEYIHSRTRFGSQLGLDRMKTLLARLGNPQDKLKFIHIAGTNGKGSVANMCASILREAGYQVGLFTSPFVTDFRERFQINGRMMEKQPFTDIVRKVAFFVEQMKEEGIEITEFEMVTAVGMECFVKMHCDIVCLEVGLGGQFDATNAIATPLLSIITSISMDHVAILGDTIEKISFEKAGIIKENARLITYPQQPVEAVAVFMEQCAKTQSTMIIPNINDIKILRCDEKGSRFIYQGIEYGISLVGEHQIYNAVTVIAAMEALAERWHSVRLVDIRVGLIKTKIPARFHEVSHNPFVVIDGAHNLQALKGLRHTLEKLEQKKVILVGMMADKDYEPSVQMIAEIAEAVVAVTVDCPRALDAQALAETASRFCSKTVAATSYEDAIEKAFSYMDEDSMMAVCGSFYLAGDMQAMIKKYVKSTK